MHVFHRYQQIIAPPKRVGRNSFSFKNGIILDVRGVEQRDIRSLFLEGFPNLRDRCPSTRDLIYCWVRSRGRCFEFRYWVGLDREHFCYNLLLLQLILGMKLSTILGDLY